VLTVANPKSWFKGTSKLWYVGVIISLVLLWAIEQPSFVAHRDAQLFCEELAFALLIASIFGLTLEKHQRTQFIELVTKEREVLKRDVFLYAYGYKVPEEIRDEIRNSVLDNFFVRRDMNIEWEYGRPDFNNLMQVKKRYSYALVNNSNDSKQWEFRFTHISADDYESVAHATFCILKVQRKEGKPTTYSLDKMQTTVDPNRPHMRAISTSIKMEPHEEVGIYYEVIHTRRTFGDDKYNCKDAVVGRTRVKIRFPSDLKFEVTVSCKTKSMREAAESDPPSLYSFEFDEGIFPHQGISVCWSTRKEIKQTTASAERAVDKPAS
jgi:hypothetical protein